MRDYLIEAGQRIGVLLLCAAAFAFVFGIAMLVAAAIGDARTNRAHDAYLASLPERTNVRVLRRPAGR